MNIQYPVRLTEDYQIQDSSHNVIVPSLTWRGDSNHLWKQKEIGELIVKLMNYNYNKAIVMCEEHPLDIPNISESSENGSNLSDVDKSKEVKRKIHEWNPNPWGRRGKPK